MLYAESAPTKKYARHLERVLLVDPHAASARLLHELLKDLGAKHIRVEGATKGAMIAAREADPQIIFTEFSGEALDGLEFTRQLRRSDLNCREAPIIMMTAEATAASIIGSRDAGVHEFLRKPYNIKDLVRRLDAVILKSRDWVEAVRYVGPDRRRFNSGDYQGPRKRKSDQQVTPALARIGQAMRILRSAVGALESDPRQALRAMQAQAVDLTAMAAATKDDKLAVAALRLCDCLEAQVKAGRLNRTEIEAACVGLWPWLPADAA
ncbi:MAG: response regulator [Alphaproteobacteria bacterium]